MSIVREPTRAVHVPEHKNRLSPCPCMLAGRTSKPAKIPFFRLVVDLDLLDFGKDRAEIMLRELLCRMIYIGMLPTGNIT